MLSCIHNFKYGGRQAQNMMLPPSTLGRRIVRYDCLKTCRNALRQNRRCLSSGHDTALQWAQANPVIAQQCLNRPPLDIDNQDPRLDSYEDYLSWRHWDVSSADTNTEHAIALTSHVLSAPMTITLHGLLPSLKAIKETQSSTCRILVIGARAESMLPIEYWEEMLILTNIYYPNSLTIQLDFTGLEIAAQPFTTLELRQSKLHINWPYKGLYHEWDDKDEEYDIFVMLNPGLGHDHLRSGWHRTLERLFRDAGGSSTFLFTAHSHLDAQRDAKVLQNFIGNSSQVVYKANAWASRISYSDPLHANHIVNPNHSYFFCETKDFWRY